MLADGHNQPENTMKKFAISLAAGASALFATAAFAAPLSNGMTSLPDGNIEQVRMVCNENGRCWRERRQRYYEDRRGYDDRGGIGIRAPGVSVGIGTNRW